MAERRRGCGVLIAVLLVLVGLGAGVAWLPIVQARSKWRAGKTAEAIKAAEEWSRLKLWRSQYHQLLAVAHLSAGQRADAQKYLDALSRGWLWIPVVKKDEVAKRLFSRGGYADFLAYDAASRERGESEDVALYRAAALTAMGRLDEAAAALGGVGDVDAKKLAALKRAGEDRKRGRWPYVVDRNGAPVAEYVLASEDVVAVNKDFEALIEKDAGKLTIEANAHRIGVYDSIVLTLDAKVQRAAMQALGGSRGALVAIDPKTNEILAVASNRGGAALENLALEEQYEPGSVMKVLTASTGIKVDFPYTCNGALPIDGRSFGDWKQEGHGKLSDFEEAFAQSCNVVFADIGLKAGREKLKQLHKAAGFDTEANLGLYNVPLGKTVGELFNDFETAFYAIGIEHETTTTLHLAMLASMMANRGVMTTPRMYMTRRSILGEVAAEAPKQTTTQVIPRASAEAVVVAMRAVVERPNGTGRRVAIPGKQLALKTGTAGEEKNGFNSLIMGFAPIDNPRIAFALVVEDAGPAEVAAAKVARDFVTGVVWASGLPQDSPAEK